MALEEEAKLSEITVAQYMRQSLYIRVAYESALRGDTIWQQIVTAVRRRAR